MFLVLIAELTGTTSTPLASVFLRSSLAVGESWDPHGSELLASEAMVRSLSGDLYRSQRIMVGVLVLPSQMVCSLIEVILE